MMKIMHAFKDFRGQPWFGMILLFVAGGLLYGHTLHAPFYFDDLTFTGNPLTEDLSLALQELFHRRGLTFLTFALNYRFGGESVIGYHLVNIALHLASAALVLLLLRRVFPQSLWQPLFGAFIFVAHPLQTQSVTYIVQRMTSLSALLCLLSLYLLIRARELLAHDVQFRDLRHLACYGGAITAGALAILAKENAVILPLAILLFCYLALPGIVGRSREFLRYLGLFWVAPCAALVFYLVYPLVAGVKLNTMADSALLQNLANNTPLNYLATQCSVLWIYVRMLFLPYGQMLDHAYPVSQELVTLQSVTGALALLALWFGAWKLRKRQPVIACGIFWFFLALSVESSVLPLDPLFEHRLYLPMLGFSLVLPALLALIPAPFSQRGIALVVVVVFAVLTWQRNALWNDPVAFYLDNIRKAPHNERAYFNLGGVYLEQGNVDEGERLLRKSLEINPKLVIGYRVLKDVYTAQGRTEDLIGMLTYALQQLPEEGSLYNDLALAYAQEGEIEHAMTLLYRAIELAPDVAVPHFNLAELLTLMGDRARAEYHVRKALLIDSNYEEAKKLLADLESARASLPENNRPAGK